MTGFLGYHPDRVLALRRALAAALVEGRGARCADPLAQAAAASWRHALQLLDPWEGRLAAITSCRFDSPYRPVAADVRLPLDYQRLLDPAWTVTTDPASGPLPPIDLAHRAGELVALLLALDPAVIGSADHTARIVELLDAIAIDGVARRLLLAGLGADGFAAVAVGLARFVATDRGGELEARLAAHVLAALSRVLGRAYAAGDAGAAPAGDALVGGGQGDPYAAALVLRHARLPVPVATSWVLRIVDSFRARRPDDLGTLVTLPGASTGEVLLAALTDDPVTGRRVLRALDDLDLLLGPHLDGDLRGRFLLATADPARFAPEASLPLVTKVLSFLADHRSVAASTVSRRDLHDWLGAYAGPYLLALTPISAVPVDAWKGADAVAVLAWVTESELAAVSYLHWLERVGVAGFDAALATRRSAPSFARLGEVAERLGVLVGTLERGRVAAAEHTRQHYDDLADGVAWLLNGLLTGGASFFDERATALGPLLDPATGWITDRAFDRLDEHGILAEPPTEAEAAAGLSVFAERQEAQLMGLGMRALHGALARGGPVPAPPPPAPGATRQSYRRQVERWAERRAGGGVYVTAATALADGLEAGRAVSRPTVQVSPLDGDTVDDVYEDPIEVRDLVSRGP